MTDKGLPTIGARLRAAREQSGLSLRQIADSTKLTVRSLEAVEADRVTKLPGGIYRRAIVRSFAREVGLDPEAILREFLAVHPDDLPPPPLPTRKATEPVAIAEDSMKRERPGFWRMVLSVFGASVPIVAGIVYFTLAWRHDDGRYYRLADVSPPRGEQALRAVSASLADHEDWMDASDRAVAVMITVSSACELQVMADGRKVVARTLAPGDVIELGLSGEILLSGSDAGAVHVSLNGRASRRFGAAGAPLNVRIGRDDYDQWLAR